MTHFRNPSGLANLRGAKAPTLFSRLDAGLKAAPPIASSSDRCHSSTRPAHGLRRSELPGTALPCSSIFMPRLSPIDDKISLISVQRLAAEILVFNISASLFCTSSPMVWIWRSSGSYSCGPRAPILHERFRFSLRISGLSERPAACASSSSSKLNERCSCGPSATRRQPARHRPELPAVCPDLDGQLVVVRDLSQTGRFHE